MLGYMSQQIPEASQWLQDYDAAVKRCFTLIPYSDKISSPFFVSLQFNYGGIQARLNGQSLEGLSESESGSELDESQVDIVSSWNIAENLPKTTQVGHPTIFFLCYGYHYEKI